MPFSDPPPFGAMRHTLFEDVQALVIGCLFTALGILMLRNAGLLSGGTAGLAFIAHYLSGWRFGTLFFIINLPFYLFGQRALGTRFTVKTFCAIGLLSLFSEMLPGLVRFSHLDPLFAAIMSGLLLGIGVLVLIRHGASLGGVGVMAIYLQKTRGWRAGTVQMICDTLILALSLTAVAPQQAALSVIGAAALNLIIGVNHRPDRYHGV